MTSYAIELSGNVAKATLFFIAIYYRQLKLTVIDK